MSKSLTVSDETYQHLEKLAGQTGIDNVEGYLDGLWEAELRRRREAVRRIDALSERIYAKYGDLGDITEMIREDRER